MIVHDIPGDIVRYGEKPEISWEIRNSPAAEEQIIEIYLLKDGNEVSPIVEDLPNTGSYVWTLTDEQTGEGYTIQIKTIDESEGIYKWGVSTSFIIDNNPWELLPDAGEEDDTMLAGLAMGPDSSPVIAYRHWAEYAGKDDNFRLHVKKWDTGVWNDLGIVNAYYLSNYSMYIDENNYPAVMYAEGSVQPSREKRYDPATQQWQQMGSMIEPNDDDNVIIYSAGISCDKAADNFPIVSYYRVTAEGLNHPDAVLVVKKRNAAGEWDFVGTNGDEIMTMNDVPVDYQGIAAMNIPYYTSLDIDNNGTPYVAFYTPIIQDNPDYFINKVWVFILQNDEWIPLGAGSNAHVAEDAVFPCLAIGSDNLPVLLYKRLSDKRLIVKKYDGITWLDLDYPCHDEFEEKIVYHKYADITDGFASLTIAGGNNPVVASSQGIKMYDVENETWLNLGYRNYPSGGMGKNSW